MSSVCEKCGVGVPTPTSPAAMANAVAAVRRTGLSLCKKCRAVSRVSKYQKTDKGKQNSKRVYSRRSPEKKQRDLASVGRWRDRMRAEGKMHALHQKYNYGLTPDMLVALCERDKVCAICKKSGSLKTDHDHSTDKVRGRLCHTCNTGLGKLGDNVAGLTRALAYLQERS